MVYMDQPPGHAVDLGHEHWYTRTTWGPDRTLNPQYAEFPDVEWWGIIIWHRQARTGEWCYGSVTFDGPVQQAMESDRPRWQVESFDPLHISPSVLCTAPYDDGPCGDHGFIHRGVWVPA